MIKSNDKCIEKYNDPNRFIEEPEPVASPIYANNYSRFQSNKDRLNPEVF